MAILAVWSALSQTAVAAETVNQGAAILKDFDGRVVDYVKLHKTVQPESHRLKPTKSPEAIKHYQDSLARGIRAARRGARQGDVFTPKITAEFRRLIELTMHGPEAGAIRESLRHAEPLAPRALRVNEAYPPAIPLQSTPPSLLLNLPPLPAELEYRVVGHTLILRDKDANLIVDFIRNAIT
ncbi:MAG: hypothetical protein ABSF54_10780 [Bryobacteraceae bacterium]|jgi:hypothetical protein